MKRRRVKITGIGPVTPAGIGREAFWKGILEPVSRVKPFTKLDPELGPFVAAWVERFSIENYVDKAVVPKGAARHTLFAIAATKLALVDARIAAADLNEENVVVVTGSSLMDFDGIGRTIVGVETKGVRGAVPRTVYTSNASVVPSSIVQVLGLAARTMSIQTSCCAGMDAIGHAAHMVARGEADIAICGGTEAPLFKCPLVELRATGLTPATVENFGRINRPFDLWRTTGVVSEGATMLVLEPESSPRPGYGYISGYAHANDTGSNLCGGLADAIRLAIADAEIRHDRVDAINAWGPGHTLVDRAESAALANIFGDRLAEIPAVSIKGSVGNPLGAAPAMQVAVAVLGLSLGILPPTVNWQFPDPACPLNLSGRMRTISHETTLVNSHGLSGVNAGIVLRKC